MAWENSEGKLRSSFQKVSRINDEKGTRTVYSRLSETDVDVHVYGVPDWIPPMEIGVTLHGGYDEEFRKVWFVVYTPEKDDEEYVALVAVEVATREWKGFWTYDKEKVREINEYIKREM